MKLFIFLEINVYTTRISPYFKVSLFGIHTLDQASQTFLFCCPI